MSDILSRFEEACLENDIAKIKNMLSEVMQAVHEKRIVEIPKENDPVWVYGNDCENCNDEYEKCKECKSFAVFHEPFSIDEHLIDLINHHNVFLTRAEVEER